VLNGGVLAVKATPLRGRLQAEPWQPPHHRANRPLPARGGVWCGTVAAGVRWPLSLTISSSFIRHLWPKGNEN